MLWSEVFLCEILPVMWSVFLWKMIHVFCNHAFCDVKYFYFLLSKYSLISGKGPLGGSRWKLLELTSVSRFLAYCTRPHDWRIRGAHGRVKPWWGKNPNMNQTCRKTLCVWVKIASLVLCGTCIFIYAVLFSVSACGEGDI